MTAFKYVAVDPDGRKIRAKADAVNQDSLRNELELRQLDVKKIRKRRSFREIELTPRKVPRSDVMHFSRQVAAFVRAGIPLVDALETVRESASNERLQEILTETAELIQVGVPFSDALDRHRDVFPPYYIGILRSAEITGRLDTVLEQLAGYIERDMEARQKIRSALTYPIVILVMSIITVVILVSYVLPKFTEFFKEFDAELPTVTKVLLDIAAFFEDYWWALALGVVVVVLVIMRVNRTPGGQRWRDRTLLRLPVIGEVVEYNVIERFCRIIASMMHAGVPLPEAMAAAIDGSNNRVYADALANVRDSMLEGEGIARPILATGLFPPAATQMMRVGEETGTLDSQMEAAADFFAKELDYKLARLTALAEPAVIIIMGVIVGFVAIALVSAMYGVFHGSKTLK
ncbi:MAG: type II secretion system F family protein [Acidimicrobiia bacterium]